MANLAGRLASINWTDLDVASGKAGGVPDAIIGLTSSDSGQREQSYWQLDNEIVLQSDLYPAAYYVIPFLLELLQNECHGRDLIYDLLYEIANGYAPPSMQCRKEGQSIPLQDACLQEISKGRRIYARDATSHKDDMIKEKADDLLGLLEDKESTK